MMRLGEAFALQNVRERWRGTSVRSRLVAAGLAAALVTALVVSVLGRGGAEAPPSVAAAANPVCGFDNRVAGNPLLAGGHAPGGVVAVAPRGAIPAIDKPRFESPDAARRWLGPNAPVVLVRVGAEVRAYPTAILLWHEVVNDVVGGRSLLVTFCPLCNTATVYRRAIDGAVHNFEVSGELALGAAVLYDRETGMRYAQPTGKPLGAAVGAADPLSLAPANPPSTPPPREPRLLRWYPSDLMTLDQAAAANPNLRVLTRETGYARPYGTSAYARTGKPGTVPGLYDGFVDTRLDPKTRLVGAVINKRPQAWLYDGLRRERVRNDTMGGKPVVIFFREDTASIADSRNLADAPAVGSAGVFSPMVDGRALHFELGGGQISDQETGTQWDLSGRATSGPLAGTRLTPLRHLDTYWYAWAGRYPDTRVWPPLPPGCSGR
jgi:Protein of unknown function (DUF3179)